MSTVSAEFVGQTSVSYKRIGKHFDLIYSKNASSYSNKNDRRGFVYLFQDIVWHVIFMRHV